MMLLNLSAPKIGGGSPAQSGQVVVDPTQRNRYATAVDAVQLYQPGPPFVATPAPVVIPPSTPPPPMPAPDYNPPGAVEQPSPGVVVTTGQAPAPTQMAPYNAPVAGMPRWLVLLAGMSVGALVIALLVRVLAKRSTAT